MKIGITCPIIEQSLKPQSPLTATNILSTKPLVLLMQLEIPSHNQTIRLRTTWYSVGLSQGWSTASWVTKMRITIYLKGEDMISLMSMPTHEANSQIICVPLLQGTILIASISPSNFQGWGQPFQTHGDMYTVLERCKNHLMHSQIVHSLRDAQIISFIRPLLVQICWSHMQRLDWVGWYQFPVLIRNRQILG